MFLLLTFLFRLLYFIFFFATMIVNCFVCIYLIFSFYSIFLHISFTFLSIFKFVLYISSVSKKNRKKYYCAFCCFYFLIQISHTHANVQVNTCCMCKFVHQTFMSELINRIKVKKPVSEQDQTQFGMNVDVCFSKLILSCTNKHAQTQIYCRC